MTQSADLFDIFTARMLPPGLAQETRECLARMARVQDLAPQQRIEGETGDDTLAFLAAGSTKLVAHASHDREQVVAFHFAGDVLTLPSRGAHSYTLEALEPCRLLCFDYTRFIKCTGSEVEILRRLLEGSTLSLRRSREKALALGRKSATERLASFLLAMAERIGTPDSEGTALALPMSRRDIADSLGLTIETVSRQFTLLRGQGLIETRGRSGVILRKTGELENLSGHLDRAA